MPDDAPAPEPAPAPESAPESGRARLLAALRRPSRGQVVVGVLLALLGFAAVTQVQANGRDDNYVGARQSDLIALINTLSLATDRAESEIKDLQQTRDSLRDDADASRTALSVARQRVETLGILAGTVPATGPGIRVTVEAPSGTIGTDQLLNGLEEMRNAGAEAIEINDSVRVVAQTGLVDSQGGALSVGGTPVQPPYVIEAIGDPDTLATAMNFDGGFADEVQNVGGTVKVQQVDDLEIATVVKPSEPTFAKPVGQE